ncbi:MAG TPA: twin-arginine translocase TatA/TatE family subunit [Sphingobacteriaceae bacterium]
MYTSTLLFLNIGTPELMAIMFVVLLLFGGKKLPELARGLGKGIREFKDASDGVKREIHRNINAVNDEMDFENTRTKQLDSDYSSTDYSSSNYSSDEYDYQSAEDLSHNQTGMDYSSDSPIEPESSVSSESTEDLAAGTKPAAKKSRKKTSNKTPENN